MRVRQTTMPNLQPYVRESGAGPAVVCIHANASSSTQWRGLMDKVSGTHRVLAPDCWNSGKSPKWTAGRDMCLEDELDLLDPVVKAAGDSFHLVGHSYGGAVALLVALRYRSRVRALALYEPTLFAVVEQQSPHPNGVDGIRDTVFAAEAALSAGKREEAAKRFIDFWMGRGSWDAIPAQRQVPIAESVVNVRHWYNALFKELTPTRAFAELQIPVLYMVGEKSPESAQSVARVLLATLPRVRVVRFPGFGHMAPVTHPDPVNDEIARFLREV